MVVQNKFCCLISKNHCLQDSYVEPLRGSVFSIITHTTNIQPLCGCLKQH